MVVPTATIIDRAQWAGRLHEGVRRITRDEAFVGHSVRGEALFPAAFHKLELTEQTAASA